MSGRRGPYRLAQGGTVDRNAPVTFRFNGKKLEGFAGDTLASALLANGIRRVGRSFKFHRPRGIFSSGTEEPNALLQLGEGAHIVPAARASVVEVTAGLQARPVSGWPGLNFDVLRVLDLAHPLWAAGFYNKTFIRPSWHVFEPIMRRMAGMGRAPTGADPDRYELANLHCDVLIVGGGRSGLTAALRYGRDGARVVLVEQATQFTRQSTGDWITATLEQLKKLPDVQPFLRTTATGIYDHGIVTVLRRGTESLAGGSHEGFGVIRADRIVLATGRIEQPLIFDHNDRPGILLAGAALEYLNRYGVSPGRQVVIATNNDSAYALATALKEAGVDVLAVSDTRREVARSLHLELRALDVALLTNSIPIETRGFGALKRVRLGRMSRDGLRITSSHEIACDALAVSGGFTPALQLLAQAGGVLAFDEASGALLARSVPENLEVIGSAAESLPIGPRFSPTGKKARQWVDLLHDVTVADLELAIRENYSAIEHVKRYTTIGMAPDQGKTSTVTTLELWGRLNAVPRKDLKHTTMRPPVTPVTLGAIAAREIGPFFSPYRQLPLHDWHLSRGTLLQDFGEWQRPVVYPKNGETREEAVRREAHTVRTAVGLFDGSSLGKIEIAGPDARTFLDRFYINDLTTLKSHRVRYGLMLRETGVIFDDGTIVKLDADRFLITTTSGNANKVAQWLEEWRQCEWPYLHLAITPVTESWATLALSGPKARTVLSKLESDIDLAPDAFQHLDMREGSLLGRPTRIYRVSFTGELCYEINVPSDYALATWQALMKAGAEDGIEPYGLDSLMLLRLEKGFLHLGTDTDGTTIPEDVGFGKVPANKKADFIGKRSLTLPEHLRRDRLQLVGLMGKEGQSFTVGSHLRVRDSRDATDGWVTSAGIAVMTHEPIALAMVRAGRTRLGEPVTLFDAGRQIGSAQVVNPPFYDASGDRMNA